ncbi:MAG: ATP-dependent 6-phosphofructokinase [Candidatus Eisenbacteria bacterium]|nr:ATP-dependent 6-phosphofructokinase [Candidatus Eisenbacteria bacterium]
MLKIGVLTGGGDCPGLNAVIRAVVQTTIKRHDGLVFGVDDGWQGMVEGTVRELTLDSVSGILPKGGTILGTSRTNPTRIEGGVESCLRTFEKWRFDALVAIGGEDTLGVALELSRRGMAVVGVPKTIDNDLNGTDYTFGFDTAINIATEAIDRLHTTAESHNRVIVVEVMGRHAGWIAVEAGIAGGADVVLIPEVPISVEQVCATINRRHQRGKKFSIVVVAEGARFEESTGQDGELILSDSVRDAFGHVKLGGIGKLLADAIEEKTGFETRYSVLGHIQRGGTPTAFDRVLATRFGVAAVELVVERQYGRMVALVGNRIVSVDIAEAVRELKTVDMGLYEIAKVFFG